MLVSWLFDPQRALHNGVSYVAVFFLAYYLVGRLRRNMGLAPGEPWDVFKLMSELQHWLLRNMPGYVLGSPWLLLFSMGMLVAVFLLAAFVVSDLAALLVDLLLFLV